MSDKFKQIIEEELTVANEDFPAEPDDETAWHFDDKEIRSLLGRVAERVQLGERDEARRKNANLVAENLRLVVEMDELREAIHDQADAIEKYEARDETPLGDRLEEPTAKYFHAEWALAYTRKHGQLGTRWEDISDEAKGGFREQARKLWQEEPWNARQGPYRKVREG